MLNWFYFLVLEGGSVRCPDKLHDFLSPFLDVVRMTVATVNDYVNVYARLFLETPCLIVAVQSLHGVNPIFLRKKYNIKYFDILNHVPSYM